MKFNHLCLRARDRFRGLFPFLLDPLRIRAVALETSTECTRRCPYCPPHSRMSIPPLRMDPAVFRRVTMSLSRRDFAGDLFFGLYGEPLCDDRLEGWLTEARAALPRAKRLIFTNGDLLTAERFLSLRRAGMDVMSLSLHSAEVPAGLRRTLEGLRRDYPELYCVHIVDYYSQYGGACGDIGLLNNKGGLADVSRAPFAHCCDIEYAAIDCLGNVLLCNNDCTGSYTFGNVGERDFYEIWEDPSFASAREAVMKGELVFEICRRCMSPLGASVKPPRGGAARLPPAFGDQAAVMEKRRGAAGAGFRRRAAFFSTLMKLAGCAMVLAPGVAAFCAGCAAAAALLFPLFAAAWLRFNYSRCLHLLRALSCSGGVEDAADFVLGDGSLFVGAMQHRSEIIPFLEWAAAGRPPGAVAEIGRARGGTLALLCRAAAPDALIISLDLPGGAFSGAVPALNRGAWLKPLLWAMRGPRQRLELIDGDSGDPASAELFSAALDGRKLDLLFIDGDHSYEAVKRDYDTYARFVKPGGVVAFHDIRPGLEKFGVGVAEFWKKEPLPGERREFVADPSQVSYGIGALRVPG
ncbi:MAG: cephalosporin hydroxylase-like protein [Elusimicrobia bacterium]|nr:MAG: cephalosporin hydroxylase-like protein [Elusimicrobiota bacterium]